MDGYYVTDRIYPRKSTLQQNFTKKVVNCNFIHKVDEKCFILLYVCIKTKMSSMLYMHPYVSFTDFQDSLIYRRVHTKTLLFQVGHQCARYFEAHNVICGLIYLSWSYCLQLVIVLCYYTVSGICFNN